jgi:hypothetical protein
LIARILHQWAIGIQDVIKLPLNEFIPTNSSRDRLDISGYRRRDVYGF